MHRVTFFASLLSAVCLASSPIFSQPANSSSSTSQPRILVSVYHPKTSPIYVPTWTLRTDDLLGSLVIQNHSTKAIRSVEFTWIADTPDDCFASGGRLRPHFGRITERMINLPADRAIRVNSLGLGMKDMLILALSEGRLLVNVEVVPSKVVYDDGAVWKSKASFHQAYDHNAVAGLADNCVDRRLVPVEKLLQARGETPECSPRALAASATKSQTLYLRKVQDDITDECTLDEDCGGGGDGSGGDQIFLGGGDGGGDGSSTSTPPSTPPPGYPNGWTCGATTIRTSCAVNSVANTCTVGYCSAGAACASQTCTAITP